MNTSPKKSLMLILNQTTSPESSVAYSPSPSTCGNPVRTKMLTGFLSEEHTPDSMQQWQRRHKRNLTTSIEQAPSINFTFQTKLKELELASLKLTEEKNLTPNAAKNTCLKMQSDLDQNSVLYHKGLKDIYQTMNDVVVPPQVPQSRVQTSVPTSNKQRLSREGTLDSLEAPAPSSPTRRAEPPMPILSKHFCRQQEPELWRIKKVNYNQKQFQSGAAASVDDTDETLEESHTTVQVREEREQKLKQIREKLSSHADQISVSQCMPIKTDKYPQFFKYKIYECFKPKNLQMARQYIQYLIHGKDVVSNPDVESYENEVMETQLPATINSKNILAFYSNFESGNLDSAYLVNERQYNLLLKVDTNTRGYTHWFYFKVANWQPGQTYTFNILNMSRDLSSFYFRGMNILTQMETGDGFKSEWSHIAGTEVLEVERQNGIVKKWKQEAGQKVPKSFYGTLKFRIRFPEDHELKFGGEVRNSRGVMFSFAYALPYSYTDLLADLQQARKFLIGAGGQVKRSAPKFDLPKIQVKEKPQPSTEMQQQTKKANEFKKMRTQIQQKDFKEKAGQYIALTKDEQRLIKSNDPAVAEERSKLLTEIQSTCTEKIQIGPVTFQQEVISSSIGGLNIYQLTITAKSRKPTHLKKVLYVQARLHSAETHGSFVMRNLIQELVENRDKYEKILQQYVIKLTPMLNVDGVTMGNSRSSLVGVDLNRRWANPNSVMHPEIYFLKLSMLDNAPRISIFIDLHGHNKKENCFFYGCNKAADEGMLSWTKTRLLPKIFAANEPIFDYENCRFNQDKFKLNTARVVVWNEMNVFNSFTLEISLYGKNTQVNSGVPTAVSVGQVGKKEYVCGERGNTSSQFVQTDFHQIACSMLKSVTQYSQLESQLDKDSWLKPSQLQAFAGESARQKLVREMRQQKDLKKRRGPDSAPQRYVGSTSVSNRNQLSLKSNSIVQSADNHTANGVVDLAQSKNSEGLNLLKTEANPKANFVSVILAACQASPIKKEQHRLSRNQNKNSKQRTSNQKTSLTENDKEPGFDAQPGKTSLPTVGKNNWRQYFRNEELEQAKKFVTQKQKQVATIESDSEDGESDSSPSCDNLEKQYLDKLIPFSEDTTSSLLMQKDDSQDEGGDSYTDGGTNNDRLQILNEENENESHSEDHHSYTDNNHSQNVQQSKLSKKLVTLTTDNSENSPLVPLSVRKSKRDQGDILQLSPKVNLMKPVEFNIIERLPFNSAPTADMQNIEVMTSTKKYSLNQYEPHLQNNQKQKRPSIVMKQRLNSQGLPLDKVSNSQPLNDDWYMRAVNKQNQMHKSHNLAAIEDQINQQRNNIYSKQHPKKDFSTLQVFGVQSTTMRQPLKSGISVHHASPESQRQRVSRRVSNGSDGHFSSMLVSQVPHVTQVALSPQTQGPNLPNQIQKYQKNIRNFVEHMQNLEDQDSLLHSVQQSREILLSQTQLPSRIVETPKTQSFQAKNSLNLQIKNPSFVFDHRKQQLVHILPNSKVSPVAGTSGKQDSYQVQLKNISNLDSLSNEGLSPVTNVVKSPLGGRQQPLSLKFRSKFVQRVPQPSQLEVQNTSTRVPAKASIIKRQFESYYESPISPSLQQFQAKGQSVVTSLSPTIRTRKLDQSQVTKMKINQTLLQDVLRNQNTPTKFPNSGKAIFSAVGPTHLPRKFSTDYNLVFEPRSPHVTE